MDADVELKMIFLVFINYKTESINLKILTKYNKKQPSAYKLEIYFSSF